ncbi:MAG: cysteine-rich CWC family protein [Gammaproteobacteria bacterium]
MEAKHCTECGAPFGCGRRDPSCWCSALPALPATRLRADADCLCPRCLERAIRHGQDAPPVDDDHATDTDPAA